MLLACDMPFAEKANVNRQDLAAHQRPAHRNEDKVHQPEVGSFQQFSVFMFNTTGVIPDGVTGPGF